MDHSTGLPHVRQGQAGDRLIAERVEPFLRQLELACDLAACSRAARLSNRWPTWRLKRVARAWAVRATRTGSLASCDRPGGSGRAGAKGQGRHGRPDGQDDDRRRRDGGHAGDEAIATAPAPGSFRAADRPRQDRPSVEEPPQVVGKRLCGLHSAWPALFAGTSGRSSRCRVARRAPAARAGQARLS